MQGARLQGPARVVARWANQGIPDPDAQRPGPAARRVLAKAGLTKDDIDLWEINEASRGRREVHCATSTSIATRSNVNGGAMALGHPIGATGSMLIGTMLDELERRGPCTGG